LRIATTPDILVLGAGGILGEAWMNGVLAGLEDADAFDARDCGGYVGTSAGSIVAAALAAGVSPGSRLGRLPQQPAVDDQADEPSPNALRGLLDTALAFGSTAAAPVASLAIGLSAPAGALARRAALARVPRGRRSLAGLGRSVEQLGVGWDGRLRIAAVELETGRRVVFGAPGAPNLSVADAVQASCAIPGVFRPMHARDRTYVDGGAWSPTNIDAADVRGGHSVLCLNPTGYGALGALSRSIAAAESLALRRRGATVTTVNPDRASAAAMGTNLMRSGPEPAVSAAGLAQGRRLATHDPVHA
jgi:NTE family protein